MLVEREQRVCESLVNTINRDRQNLAGWRALVGRSSIAESQCREAVQRIRRCRRLIRAAQARLDAA